MKDGSTAGRIPSHPLTGLPALKLTDTRANIPVKLSPRSTGATRFSTKFQKSSGVLIWVSGTTRSLKSASKKCVWLLSLNIMVLAVKAPRNTRNAINSNIQLRMLNFSRCSVELRQQCHPQAQH